MTTHKLDLVAAPYHGASYTPKPWNRNIKPATKYNTIYAGRNTHVAHLATQGLTPEEVEGNCNLIAAAPDLLEALVGLVTRFRVLDHADQAALNAARGALAKAVQP